MPGLLRGVARTAAIAGTASAVSGRVQRRQNQRWAAEDQAQQPVYQQPAPAPAPAPAAAPAESGEMAELKQLADLHAQGILTDEEFAAKKAQILGI